MVNIMELKEEIRRVGDEIMKLYRGEVEIQNKADFSPVTEADLLSNKLLVEILGKTGIPILSEEIKDNSERLNSDKLWIIDPLDGTKDFIQKTDEFSIMVALVEKGEPILGVVYAPVLGKMYYAEKGQGAFVEFCHFDRSGEIPLKIRLGEKGKGSLDCARDDKGEIGGFIGKKQLAVSNKNNFTDWTILVSRNHLGKEEVKLAKRLVFREKRPTGSIGVKLGLIAEGEAEIYLHSLDKTWEWDIAAPQIILEEAGGIITDIDGNFLQFNKEIPKNFRGILATNGTRHKEIVRELGVVSSE